MGAANPWIGFSECPGFCFSPFAGSDSDWFKRLLEFQGEGGKAMKRYTYTPNPWPFGHRSVQLCSLDWIC